VFAICGTIRFCSLAGTNTGCAFVEFSAPEEAGERPLNGPARDAAAAARLCNFTAASAGSSRCLTSCWWFNS
jgi:hypothetical protein